MTRAASTVALRGAGRNWRREAVHGDHGYAWLMHAAAVWQVSRDRPRTLALLREARDHDPRDLTNEFRTPAFQDVQDDPEFLQAISRSS